MLCAAFMFSEGIRRLLPVLKSNTNETGIFSDAESKQLLLLSF